MSENHQVIDVRFFEGDGEEPFAISSIPIEQLPDTFAVDTVLNLGDQDWQVIRASPEWKRDFAKTGILDLFLSRYEVQYVDPKEILYSLPTISHDLPEMEQGSSLEQAVIFREDDWRQSEFVTRRHEQSIDGTFQAIVNIYENHREGPGFNHLHLREEIVEPLANAGLTLDMLNESFEFIAQYDAVAFNSATATIVGGFVLQTASGWFFWGQASPNGELTALNLVPTEQANVGDIANEMDAFVAKHDLYFIDWPRLFWCGPGHASFTAYDD